MGTYQQPDFDDITRREQETKVCRLRILNEHVIKGQILFTGSSLMEQFPIDELLMTEKIQRIVYNRGIGGFTTDDMLAHMEEQVFGTEPSKIFINIGTNDIANVRNTFEENLEHAIANYRMILTRIKERLPQAEVYLMAYYPVNETDKIPDTPWADCLFVNRNNRNIPKANLRVKELAEAMGYHYIDVNDGLTDERGQLKQEYTVEGIHMYANGYRVVLRNMRAYL